MPDVVLASFNVHAGVDGWGRPFDVAGACRKLDADILVLEESWAPDEGEGVARQVAQATGLEHVFELEMARGRLFGPRPEADHRWGPPTRDRSVNGMVLRRQASQVRASHVRRLAGAGPGRPGSLGLAVLTRLHVSAHSVIDLGRLPKDAARRGAVVVELDVEGARLTVVGTHLSHLFDGSPVQLARLRAALPSRRAPGVLAGDMNLFGLPLSLALPGWRRAVRGRTWPAWRPLVQPDHILSTASVTVSDAEVVPVQGSDHLPVRARLVF